MKFAINNRDKERKICEKYKKVNAQLKKELRELKGIFVEISNLVQHISVNRSITQIQEHNIDRKVRQQKQKLPNKRLDYRRHRAHRLSSSLIKLGSSNISLSSIVTTDISSIQSATMNSSFVIKNLSNENEACIDNNPICGWVSPESDSGSSVYLTAKSSVRSTDEPLVFYDANDSYDADAEMSEVLMHGDKTINQSDIHDRNSLQLLQSQSLCESMDFSIQSPFYVTQQTSDFFSDFGEIMCNETNNNDVLLPQDIHHLKVQLQPNTLLNSPIIPSGSIASANLSQHIGYKSPAHQPQHQNSSIQQEKTGVMVNQNTEQRRNESALSIGERSQFEYQSDESHLQDDDQLVPATATNADVTEISLSLFPKYPNIFGSSLNTSSAFNFRSPSTNETRNIIETHDESIDDFVMGSAFIGDNKSIVSHYDDSIGEDLLALARDLSSSSSMFDDSIASESVSYESVFNTSYMQQAIEYFAQENACEFSIAEYLSPELIENEQLEDSCSCCLCQLCEKNGSTLDVCIRKHPDTVRCQKLQTKGAVCNACMDSMVLISKRNKTKHYRCIDKSCHETFKTLSSLRNHYLKHLKCKMYFCDFCSKTYNTLRDLRIHERSHANK